MCNDNEEIPIKPLSNYNHEPKGLESFLQAQYESRTLMKIGTRYCPNIGQDSKGNLPIFASTLVRYTRISFFDGLIKFNTKPV